MEYNFNLAIYKTEGEIKLIPINKIDIDQRQPRQSIRDLKALANDMDKRGQLYPIIITPYLKIENKIFFGMDAIKKNHRFFIIDGERRYRALKLLKKTFIKCIIKIDIKGIEVYETQFTSNSKRLPVNPVEMAKSFRRYIEECKKNNIEEPVKRLSKLTGFNKNFIESRLDIFDLDERIIKKIENNELEPTIAQEIKNLPEEFKEKTQECLINGNIDSSELKIINDELNNIGDFKIYEDEKKGMVNDLFKKILENKELKDIDEIYRNCLKEVSLLNKKAKKWDFLMIEDKQKKRVADELRKTLEMLENPGRFLTEE